MTDAGGPKGSETDAKPCFCRFVGEEQIHECQLHAEIRLRSGARLERELRDATDWNEASKTQLLTLYETQAAATRLERELAEAREERDAARDSLDRLQQTWAENAPAVWYKAESERLRQQLAELRCDTCATQAAGLPTPGYSHSANCTAALRQQLGQATTDRDAARIVLKQSQDYGESLEQQLEQARAALREIAKGEGRYSRDPLTHAANTIEDMKALAAATLAASQPEPEPGPPCECGEMTPGCCQPEKA